MVMDFGDLKFRVGSFLDKFDHSLILCSVDPLVTHAEGPVNLTLDYLNPRWITVPYNPTAENMAIHFFAAIDAILKETAEDPMYRVQLEGVRVHETETGYAECKGLVRDYPFEETTFSESIEQEASAGGGAG